MQQTSVASWLRVLVLAAIIFLMAAASSGAVPVGWWSGLHEVDSARAQEGSPRRPDRRAITYLADNGPACDARPGPRLQTSRDASGVLRATITAAIASDGETVTLHEIRIGPLQNAAVDAGPVVARTTPFVVTLAGGTTQAALRVTRIVPDQPNHVSLLVVDDCGEWRTFVGGGTGIAVAPPIATATPVTIAPGQPHGTIPIGVTVFGSSQFPPGSRPRARITTRSGAVCWLSITWPNGQSDALPPQQADQTGLCLFRPLVPLGMRSGSATAFGTVQDIFGLNSGQASFMVGGTLDTIPPGDNIAPFQSTALEERDGNDNADNLDNDNAE